MKTLLTVVATVATTIGLLAVAPTADAASSHAVVGYWHDGDTVRLASGTYVRLIGVDTAEVGTGCRANAQTALAKRLAPAGSTVTLVRPEGEPNTDKYGRLLRYVENRSGADIGYQQIARRGAKARYDGRDGYSAHPREARYRSTDRRRSFSCSHSAGHPTGSSGGSHHSAAGGSLGRGAYRPISTWNCPRIAPIKGNASSHIFHRPGQAFYTRTTPEICFVSAAAAIAHGYRASKI